MSTTHHDKSAVQERAEAHREIIEGKLDKIATEVGAALRNAALNFPVYFAIPTSGNSLLTFATPADPADGNWSKTSAIICKIVGEKLGGVNLSSRALPCAVVNAEMEVAEVIPYPDPSVAA